MKTRIAIIGAGRIGQAIKTILEERNEVRVWDKDPAKIPHAFSLRECVEPCTMVILCIPSVTLREALSEMQPFLSPKAIVVSVIKGIEVKTHKLPHELIREFFPKNPLALLGGPLMAEEIQEKRATRGIIAASLQTQKKVQAVFFRTCLFLDATTDVRGVALCGVLKNIYAMVLGLADGMRVGCNAKALLCTKALSEMERVVSMLKGKKQTVHSVAGISDLIATGYSEHSRNRKFGEEMAGEHAFEGQCEGSVSVTPLASLLGGRIKEFSILSFIYSCIIRKRIPQDVGRDFLFKKV